MASRQRSHPGDWEQNTFTESRFQGCECKALRYQGERARSACSASQLTPAFQLTPPRCHSLEWHPIYLDMTASLGTQMTSAPVNITDSRGAAYSSPTHLQSPVKSPHGLCCKPLSFGVTSYTVIDKKTTNYGSWRIIRKEAYDNSVINPAVP